MQKKKVLYYCSWGGFGHIARAYSVLKFMDWAEITICSPQPWIFPALENVNFVQITEPKSLIHIKDGKIARKDYGEIDDTLGYRKFLTEYLEILGRVDPDLVIVDITSEIALVTQLMGYKTFVVYETLKTEDLRWTFAWNSSDRVIVPYTKDFTDDLDYKFSDNSFYAGGYSRFEGDEKPSREMVRAELGLSDSDSMYLLTMGKARMGEQAILQIIGKLSERQNSKIYMPYYEPDDWTATLEVKFPNLIIVKKETNLGKYFAAADLVLSGAGYNSTMETFEFRVPAIFFPLERIHGEQLNKARTAERLGACQFIEISQENWIDQLQGKLDFYTDPINIENARRAQAQIVDGQGARRLAEFIKNYLEGNS